MPFKIVRNDITKMKTEAIVNAANIELRMGGGVCGAIFKAAGADKLQNECDSIGSCKVGEAAITKGYNLHAKKIIHTVGPIWRGGDYREEELLYKAYKNSLHLALEHNLESISFPLISSGIYGYPKDQALSVALSAISDFLLENDMEVYLVVYGKETLLLSQKLFSKIEQYIDNNYIDDRDIERKRRGLEVYEMQDKLEGYVNLESVSAPKEQKRSLEDLIDKRKESFSEMLLRLIDQKGLTDIETYKKANVDRRLFSKIRSNNGYSPSKVTAISFSIALELNLDETKDLLRRAGYALSPSNKFDLIIQFFIEDNNYDIYQINEALFDFNETLLGV